jgi:hypothetical protein
LVKFSNLSFAMFKLNMTHKSIYPIHSCLLVLNYLKLFSLGYNEFRSPLLSINSVDFIKIDNKMFLFTILYYSLYLSTSFNFNYNTPDRYRSRQPFNT